MWAQSLRCIWIFLLISCAKRLPTFELSNVRIHHGHIGEEHEFPDIGEHSFHESQADISHHQPTSFAQIPLNLNSTPCMSDGILKLPKGKYTIVPPNEIQGCNLLIADGTTLELSGPLQFLQSLDFKGELTMVGTSFTGTCFSVSGNLTVLDGTLSISGCQGSNGALGCMLSLVPASHFRCCLTFCQSELKTWVGAFRTTVGLIKNRCHAKALCKRKDTPNRWVDFQRGIANKGMM